MRSTICLLTSLLLLTLGAGCAENGSKPGTSATKTTSRAGGGEQTDPATAQVAPAPPSVELAASPKFDLLHNRYLWHLLTGEGVLVLPMVDEGFRKYTQEYRKPWGDVVEVSGRSGRILSAKGAALNFHWFDEVPTSAKLTLDVLGGTARQKATLRLNGKQLANISFDAGWSQPTVSIPSGLLRRGENSLKIIVAKKAPVHGKRSYALWRSISIGPADATTDAELPMNPMSGDKATGLSGARLVMMVEIPVAAWLSANTETQRGAKFKVIAQPVGGEPITLLDAEQKAGSKKIIVSLAKVGGKLVALELRATGDGAWEAPWIGVEARPAPADLKPFKNTILVVVDALRSNKLTLYDSVYGETRVKTPRMTEYAKKGAIVFLHNQAASPSSPPSHGSIQTGMIPRVHGVDGDKGQIRPGTPTVSTQLGAHGIATGYYGNNPFGMARHERPGKWTEFHQTNKEGKGIDCTALMDEMLDFAKRMSDAGKRFFISSLPYETHTPYRYHKGITEHYFEGPYDKKVGKSVNGVLLGALSAGKVTLNDKQWAQLKGLYDGEAEHMDGCFGQLIDGLEKMGILDDTAIVLTSDHGEGMYEHGKMGHAFGHFRELGDVPLILYSSRLAEGVVFKDVVTSHLDITPTVLALMGIKADDAVQGLNVLPIGRREGPWTPRVVSLEYGRSWALRARDWKLIADYQGVQSFFDLKADLWEQKDLADGGADLGLRYMRDMAGFFLKHRSDWKSETFGDLNNHAAGFLSHVEALSAP